MEIRHLYYNSDWGNPSKEEIVDKVNEIIDFVNLLENDLEILEGGTKKNE